MLLLLPSQDDDVRNVEILDGPKVINISVTEENPVSTLIITGLIPGLSYDIQVCSSHSQHS